MSTRDGLDQFYTTPETAQKCLGILEQFIADAGIQSPEYIEPSAGAGVFLSGLPSSTIAMDIAPPPDCSWMPKRDYLAWKYAGSRQRSRMIVVGNPPFGQRGKTAVAFINHAASMADTIAFILPSCFRKWGSQKQIAPDLSLQSSTDLRGDLYLKPNGRTVALNTVFQIWSRHTPFPNLRKTEREPTSHPDFKMWQYNNTRAAERYFEMPFDFAAPCQGWQNYAVKRLRADECERHKQWMLLLATAPTALETLYRIDFQELAHRNGTAVPGYRKNDVVSEYERLVSLNSLNRTASSFPKA